MRDTALVRGCRGRHLSVLIERDSSCSNRSTWNDTLSKKLGPTVSPVKIQMDITVQPFWQGLGNGLLLSAEPAAQSYKRYRQPPGEDLKRAMQSRRLDRE